MNSAKVSIIIPVCNGANFLEAAIESALNQTYKNVEVVVVNDGSNDGGMTERIALSYGDNVRYLVKTSGGAASALNLGLSQMTGDYFLWLSQEQLLHPDKVQKSIDAANKGASRSIVITDFRMEDAAGNSKGSSQLIKSIPGILSLDVEEYQYALIKAFFESRLHMCSALIPSQVIKELGAFDEKLIATQDYDFLLRLAQANYRIILLEEPLLTIRPRAHQDADTKNATHLHELESLYLRVVESFKPALLNLPLRLYFNFIDTMYRRGLETVCFNMLNAVAPVRDEPQTPIWLYWENREGRKTPEYIYQCWYSIIMRNRNDFSIAIVTPKTLPDYLPNLNKKYLGFQEIAHRADYIRFNLLREYGGAWLDSDFISFRSLSPIKRLIDEKGFVCTGYKDEAGILFPIISFLASKKNNPIVGKMVASIDRFIEGPLSLDGRQPLWDEIGGNILKEVLLGEPEYIAIDVKSFYPVPTHNSDFIIRNECQIIRDESIQVDFETLAYGQNISNSDFGDVISKLSKQELFNPATILGRVFLMGLSDISCLPASQKFSSKRYFWEFFNVGKNMLKKSPFLWGMAKRIQKCVP